MSAPAPRPEGVAHPPAPTPSDRGAGARRYNFGFWMRAPSAWCGGPF